MGIYQNLSSEYLSLSNGMKLMSQKGVSSYEDEEGMNYFCHYLFFSASYGETPADLEPVV